MIPTSSRRAHFGRQDRRAELREVCAGDAVMDVLSPKPLTAVHVRVLDIASASLKLAVPDYVSPGSLVRIHMTEASAHAEVRYCTCEASQYYVGVRVEEFFPAGA